MKQLQSLHRHAFTVCCRVHIKDVCFTGSRAATWWISNRLSIYLCVFEWNRQKTYTYVPWWTPSPKLNPTPPRLLPVFSSSHTLPLQTLQPQHIPTGCNAHIDPKWILSQQTGPVQLKTRHPVSFLSIYTLTPLASLPPSLAGGLFLFTDAKHQALEFNWPFMFPVREFYNHALYSSSSLCISLKAVTTPRATYWHVRSPLECTSYT